MMNQIYRNDSFAESLFGACMERAIQMFEEPTAVRNRSIYLKSKIEHFIYERNDKLNLLSVACGPAEEIKLALESLSQDQLNRVTFNLLDQDEGALQYAQMNIKNRAVALNKRININLINRSIKDIFGSGLGESFDLVYSAGLFDYFADPVASKICRTLCSCIKNNGKLIIGNFNAKSTSWFGMLALFDWSLILRTQEDLIRLFKVEGFTATVESEEKNINLFCNLTKL